MKKIFNASGRMLVLAITMMFISTVAHAQEGAVAVDKICIAFGNMTKQVSAITSIEELDNIDFTKSIMDAGIEDISDDCQYYVLKAEDKKKIILSVNKMIDAMSAKGSNLTGGTVTKAQMDEYLAPFKTKFRDAINNSTTLGNLLQRMSNM